MSGEEIILKLLLLSVKQLNNENTEIADYCNEVFKKPDPIADLNENVPFKNTAAIEEAIQDLITSLKSESTTQEKLQGNILSPAANVIIYTILLNTKVHLQKKTGKVPRLVSMELFPFIKFTSFHVEREKNKCWIEIDSIDGVYNIVIDGAVLTDNAVGNFIRSVRERLSYF